MTIATARFLSLFLTALALGPALAHLLALPNKILLPREQYLVVQQIYRGWALLGFLVYGAILFIVVVTFLSRRERRAMALAAAAVSCLLAAQVVFWSFTFPVNQSTHNWTVLPDAWEPLRRQWEYSHAAGALLTVAAMVLLILSVLPPLERRS